MNVPARPAQFDAAKQRRRVMIAKVHVLAKQIDLAGDDYVAVVIRVTGHTSSAACTDAELVALVKELERLGGSTAARGGKPKPADHPMARKARAMWISLHQLGAVRDPRDTALESFAQRQLKVAKLQWANQSHAYKLIEALKAMAERAGWAQDLTGIPANNTVRVLKIRLVDRLLVLLKAAAIVPADWGVRVTADRLGGIDLAGGLPLASMGELDTVARLFGNKLRDPALTIAPDGRAH